MTVTVFSKKQIVSNITTLLSGVVLARGISAITLILTARYLGPDTFGQYAACLGLTRILAVLFALGLDTWLLRSGGKDLKLIRDRSSASLVIEVFLGAIWIVGLIFIAPNLNQDAFPQTFVTLFALAIYFEELGNTVASSFKAALKNTFTMIMLSGNQLLLLIATVILISQGSDNANNFILARAVTTAVAAFLFFLIFIRIFGFHFNMANVRLALRETKSFGASVALGNIALQADVVIVANWAGKTAAGFYAPAITIASTLFLIPSATYGVMLPVLSSTYEKSVQAVKKVSKQLLLLSLLVGSLMAIVTFLLARPVMLQIYGPEYASSGDILRMISVIMVFRFISFSGAAILAAVRWQRYRVAVQAVVIAIAIGLNIYVVQIWGIMGVAGVYVFAEAVLMLGYSTIVFVWFRKYQQKQPAPITNI